MILKVLTSKITNYIKKGLVSMTKINKKELQNVSGGMLIYFTAETGTQYYHGSGKVQEPMFLVKNEFESYTLLSEADYNRIGTETEKIPSYSIEQNISLEQLSKKFENIKTIEYQ